MIRTAADAPDLRSAPARRTSRRMPDFAGVALVDILANGVAMLIIVIVVTIAARMEREERYAEQADEIAAVMSHKFSTSLVLNSLAASPPARLHDYDASPLDQVLDPDLLPILELHPGFVREFYSGTIWTRRELLEAHGGLGAWLAGFSDERKSRLRVDVYDIPQFYLTMSILREHGIRVYHWHFLTGALSPREAARCPPGVAAKDCPGGDAEAPAPLPRLALDDAGAGGLAGLESPLYEPPSGGGRGADGAGGNRDPSPDGSGGSPGPMPGGAVPGMAGSAHAGFGARGGIPGSSGTGLRPGGATAEAGGAGRGPGDGDPEAAGARRGLLSGPRGTGQGRGFGADPGLDPDSAATLGSFPGARQGGGGPSAGADRGRPGREGQGRAGQGAPPRTGSDPGGDGPRFTLRIALPESIRREARSGSLGAPALEAMFGVILHYLGELQDTLDAGGTPSPRIDGFAQRIQDAFRAPPPITGAEREVARDLALKFALLPHLGAPTSRPDPLALRPAPPGPRANAALVVAPNRLNDAVGVHRGGAPRTGTRHEEARAGGAGRSGEGQGVEGGTGARRGGGKRAGESPTGDGEGVGRRAGEGPGSDGEDAGRRAGEGPGGARRGSEARNGGGRGGEKPAGSHGTLPGHGRAALAINAYPGIWKGLEIRIEPWSVLLAPPAAREAERMRWRAVAYVTPRLDDFIVGFVFADMDPEGRLRIQAEANRVRLDGRPLLTGYREATFGSRGWLVSLYAALAAGLLLLGVGWRYLAVRSA